VELLRRTTMSGLKAELLVRYTPLGQVSNRECWLIDRDAWEALSRSPWYLHQEIEPRDPRTGKSFLLQWLIPSAGQGRWQCHVPIEGEGWCLKTFTRADRGITHVRGHLGHKPYPCQGRCGDQNWYAGEPLPRNSLNNTLTTYLALTASLPMRRSVFILGGQTCECVNTGESDYTITCSFKLLVSYSPTRFPRQSLKRHIAIHHGDQSLG
jgi:hypothetical protein